ncbi:hypothetical protein ACOME3_006411 [Neoechinorhynchus agilis]
MTTLPRGLEATEDEARGLAERTIQTTLFTAKWLDAIRPIGMDQRARATRAMARSLRSIKWLAPNSQTKLLQGQAVRALEGAAEALKHTPVLDVAEYRRWMKDQGRRPVTRCWARNVPGPGFSVWDFFGGTGLSPRHPGQVERVQGSGDNCKSTTGGSDGGSGRRASCGGCGCSLQFVYAKHRTLKEGFTAARGILSRRPECCREAIRSVLSPDLFVFGDKRKEGHSDWTGARMRATIARAERRKHNCGLAPEAWLRILRDLEHLPEAVKSEFDDPPQGYDTKVKLSLTSAVKCFIRTFPERRELLAEVLVAQSGMGVTAVTNLVLLLGCSWQEGMAELMAGSQLHLLPLADWATVKEEFDKMRQTGFVDHEEFNPRLAFRLRRNFFGKI